MSLKNDEKYVESTFVDTTVDGIFKFVFRAWDLLSDDSIKFNLYSRLLVFEFSLSGVIKGSVYAAATDYISKESICKRARLFKS
jgi:hypothetical protein